jgi:hypothetical protein
MAPVSLIFRSMMTMKRDARRSGYDILRSLVWQGQAVTLCHGDMCGVNPTVMLV